MEELNIQFSLEFGKSLRHLLMQSSRQQIQPFSLFNTSPKLILPYVCVCVCVRVPGHACMLVCGCARACVRECMCEIEIIESAQLTACVC